MRFHVLTLTVSLPIMLAMTLGCGGKVDPILFETHLTAAQNAVADAQRSQAETYAKEQIEKAKTLLDRSQQLQREGNGRRGLELVFQAEMEAQIATAYARQQVAKGRIDQAYKDRLEAMMQDMTYQIQTAQTYQVLAEARAERALARAIRAEGQAAAALSEADGTRVQMHEARQRSQTQVTIDEAELYLDIAKEVEAMTHATDDYRIAEDAIRQAISLLNQGEFERAQEIAIQAKEQAKIAREVAVGVTRKAESVKSESNTKAVIDITRAQTEIDRASRMNAFVHAADLLQQATSSLKQANEAVESEQYDQASKFARQAEADARQAYTISEAVERRRRTREAEEELIAAAKDAIFKTEDALRREDLPNLSAEIYDQARISLAAAKKAFDAEQYQSALDAGRRGYAYLENAIKKVEQIVAIETGMIQTANEIPYAEIQQTAKGVLIRFDGDLFESGQTDVNREFFPALRKLANLIQTFDAYKVRVEGHSDNSGDAGLNLRLTEQRVAQFVKYLVETGGVAKERLTAVGLGEAYPIVTNSTSEGRKQNRRVDTVILTRE